MKYRKLRIAFSAVFGILCLLLIALWVRSYWWHDILAFYHPSEIFQVGSFQGELIYSSHHAVPPNVVPHPWATYSAYITSTTDFPLIINGQPAPRIMGFGWYAFGNNQTVFVPHWFPIIVAAALGAASWIHWKNQFSLRTLLIVITLAAVVLGLIVFLNRAPTSPPFDVGDFTTGED